MGNGCCFGEAGGRMAVGSSMTGQHNHPSDGPNDAVSLFLKSRGYHGLFSQIEVSFLSPLTLFLTLTMLITSIIRKFTYSHTLL